MDRKRKGEEAVAQRPTKVAKALPEFLQGSSISGHMAAKHIQIQPPISSDETTQHLHVGINSMEHFGQGSMTEEQRQEAFKRAYMAELERYNEENKDNEEVEVEVDKKGWDAEMNGDMNLDDELEDVEWEWCDEDENPAIDEEIAVCGRIKKLNMLTDDDLANMTDDEYLVSFSFYICELKKLMIFSDLL
jgi:hypothetical protein